MGVCQRDPWGLRRTVRRHTGETGVVAYGWYNRLRGWTSYGDWDAVLVRVDGRERAVLHQLKRGPVWIPLEPGRHVVEFLGGREPLRVEQVDLHDCEAVVISFKPQERIPFRRRPTREQWCLRRLWGGNG